MQKFLFIVVVFFAILDGNQRVSFAGERVDLAGYKAVLMDCEFYQEIFASTSADNSFDIPSGGDYLVQIVNPRGIWATIGRFGPSQDGLETVQRSCMSNPQAFNIHLTGPGKGPFITIYWVGDSTEYVVRRSGQKIWLERASPSQPPLPPPPPPPPPSDRDSDGILDIQDRCPDQWGPASNNGCPIAPPPAPISGNTATDGNRSITLEIQNDGHLVLHGLLVCDIQMFYRFGAGQEEFLIPRSNCVFTLPNNALGREIHIRIANWWWVSSGGCAYIFSPNELAWLVVLKNCFSITPIPSPPPPKDKDIICLLAGPDRRFDDLEIVRVLDLWIAQDNIIVIPDGMMIAIISLWVTGDDCGKFTNVRFSSLGFQTKEKKKIKILFKKAKRNFGSETKCKFQQLELAFGLRKKLSSFCSRAEAVKGGTTLPEYKATSLRQLSISNPIFEITQWKAVAVKIEIFSAAGDFIYRSSWEAARFGKSNVYARIVLSNGVYIAKVIYRDALGNEFSDSIRKFLIFR